MTTDAQKRLAKAVAQAAGEAVNRQGNANAIDVLLGIGWLKRADLEAWRRGKAPYLEHAVSANLSKVSRAMKEFRAWATAAKLKGRITHYHSFGRRPKRELRSVSLARRGLRSLTARTLFWFGRVS